MFIDDKEETLWEYGSALLPLLTFPGAARLTVDMKTFLTFSPFQQ